MNPVDPSALRASLAQRGHAVVVTGDVARAAALDPWGFAQSLLGEAPRMVERQAIRAVPGGRSFASTDIATPLHTDSQRCEAAPPDVQVMVCARPAERGGESTLADAWAIAEALERDDATLFRALFEAPRRIPFVFGDVYGPTLGLRGAGLAFTHSPMPPREDPVGEAVARRVAAHPVTALGVRAGEVLVVDNRRMLHGRTAFGGGDREFVRLLVWLDAPVATHPRYEALARAARQRLDEALARAPADVRAPFGLASGARPLDDRRLRAVLAMLRGASPGMIAAREGVPEPELYRWRDAALEAASAAVGALRPGPALDADCRDAAAALRARAHRIR